MSLHDPRRRDDLPYMALGVLGGVHQQADHGRGEGEAADAARLEERRFRSGSELCEGALDLLLESLGESSGLVRWGPGSRFAFQECPLLRGEPLASGVGEKPVQAAGGVADMETHGRSPAGPRPEMRLGERSDSPAHVFYRLEKSVSHRL
jgi:hypothetical protein